MLRYWLNAVPDNNNTMSTTDFAPDTDLRFGVRLISDDRNFLKIYAETDDIECIYVTLLNAGGQCVYTQKCDFSPDKPFLLIYLKTFPEGLYFLSVVRRGMVFRRYVQVA